MSELSKLVPDYYIVKDLLTHDSEEQLSEEELKLRGAVHFGLSESDIESLLNGEDVTSDTHKVKPGYVNSVTLADD